MRRVEGDFVLPVDKPEGPTSHDVVAAARRALGTRRIGHTGTLDPFASGLLLLCVGRATRIAELLSGMDKTYEATARLGVETDTLDRDGTAVGEPAEDIAELPVEAVEAAFQALRGAIEQVPPQFSAKKVEGEAMHRRARRGERVELPPVPVTVHALEVTSFDPPDVRFTVRCSSGTYIRALARDAGRTLGVGAHLTALRRTAVGSFQVASAVSMDELTDPSRVTAAAVEPLEALSHMERVEVDDGEAARLVHGQRVRLGAPAAEGPDEPRRVLVAHDAALLAIGELDDGLLRPRKVFAR